MSDNQPHLSQLHGENKKEKVRNMFNGIAGHYDFLNHFLSFGIDYYWRNQVLKIIKTQNPNRILDVATGTGDLAILATKSKAQSIIGVDISEAMLRVGEVKIKNKGLDQKIKLLLGDSENLPFEDHSFDLAMVSFGVRNFMNLQKGLEEINRVLKPGAMLIVLEFAYPRHFPMKQLYKFYSTYILPVFGKLVSNDANAYTYLPESVKIFPAFEQFLTEMNKSGYTKTSYKSLSSGIACIYTGVKP